MIQGPKIIGYINLGLSTRDKRTNETVLQCRDNRTEMALSQACDEEEYNNIMEERLMCHWLQLGINKEITDRYFYNH